MLTNQPVPSLTKLPKKTKTAMEKFTDTISLEAIFIGIFLLMASNKAEADRDKKHEKQRVKDRKQLDRDIKLDQKADRQLTEIKSLQKDLDQKLDRILTILKKTDSSL
jgi:hypothetical protein